MTTFEDRVEQEARARRVVVARPRPVRDAPLAHDERSGSRPVRRPVPSTSQPAPGREMAGTAVPASPTTSIGNVLLAFAVGLVVATIFSAQGLVHSGHGMPDGIERNITLTAGNAVLHTTQALHLTWPWDRVETALGRVPVQSSSPLLASAGSGPPAVRALPTLSPAIIRPTSGPRLRTTLVRPRRRVASGGGRAKPYPQPMTALRVPTAHNPLRLLVTGDSLTEYLGPQMDDMAAQTGRIRGSADTHYGTGLVRPDFVDWSVVARQQIAAYHPEAVVMFIGGNDFQNIAMLNGQILQAGSPAWTREYQRRAAIVMRMWIQGGTRRVYWLSLPPARSDAWSYNNAQIDLALQRAVKQVPGAEYLNILGPITNHGRYSDYVNWAGQPTLVRASDGIHLSEAGSSIVAGEVLMAVKREWHLTSKR